MRFVRCLCRSFAGAVLLFPALVAYAHATGVHYIDVQSDTIGGNDPALGFSSISAPGGNVGYDSRFDSPLGLTSNEVSTSFNGVANVLAFSPAAPVPETFNLTGSSFGAADLASGSVKAFATGTSFRNDSATGDNAVVQADSGATLVDTLTFNLPDKGPANSTEITFAFHLHGSFAGVFGSADFAGLVCEPSLFSAGSKCASFGHDLSFGTSTGNTSSGWGTFTATPADQASGDFVGTFQVAGNDPVLMIQMNLFLDILGETTADFGDTGFVNISVPDGGTFTSDSGVFLSNPLGGATTAVPEPDTRALLGAGLLVLIAFARIVASDRTRKQRHNSFHGSRWSRCDAPPQSGLSGPR